MTLATGAATRRARSPDFGLTRAIASASRGGSRFAMRKFLSLIAASAAVLAPALAVAQVVPPVAPTQAFDSAVAEGCVPVISETLSLNAPSETLARSSLVAWQPSVVEQAAFSDFSAEGRAFARRPSTVGTVVVGHDAARGVCRVAVVGATERDVQAIRSYIEALVRTLTRAGPNAWTGSIDASPRLRVVQQNGVADGGPAGAPQLTLTFTREPS